MITGTVNSSLEATVALFLQDANGQTQPIDVTLDTGFNGFLTLPSARIASLGARWLCREQATLADGSFEWFDVYEVTIIWDGQLRTIEVESADATPLLGMALLHKNEVRIEVVAGGTVSLTPLP